MGDEQEGDADLLLQLGQFGAHRLAQLGVEGRQRLVQQQHARPLDQGAGQGHPLALAAGELVGLARAEALELDQRQSLLDPPRRARRLPTPSTIRP